MAPINFLLGLRGKKRSPGRVRIRGRWDRVGDLRIHALESIAPYPATSQTVVLVHGLSVSSRYMVPTMELLASKRRVYAPDLPGFGRSEKPREILDVPGLAGALAAWMEETGAGPAVLLGNSFGCQIVSELAVGHPALVSGLVLVSPTVDPRRRSAIQQLGRWMVDISLEPPSLWPLALRDYLVAGPRRTLITFRHMLRHRIESLLPRIGVPALVVHGGKDPLASGDWAEKAARLLPKGQVTEIPGAAHALNFNSPDRLAPAVEAFLKQAGLEEPKRLAAA